VAENAPGTSTGNASGTATITEGDALSATAMTFNATTGSPFTGTVATFTDTATAAVASNFTATIDWGDGTTSTGTVVGGSGSFQVSGTHTYAAPGQYAVNVTISDPGGTATAAAASTANVVPAATPPTTPTPALGSAGAALLVGMVLAFGVWRRRALTRARTPRA
ncbi:MAG TPA: hypothetical protein VFB32_18090, partial [Rudaea sp.]|nr:hypothetical protein [Rudaea sp.]